MKPKGATGCDSEQDKTLPCGWNIEKIQSVCLELLYLYCYYILYIDIVLLYRKPGLVVLLGAVKIIKGCAWKPASLNFLKLTQQTSFWT